MPDTVRKIRCAVYTRKSTEEGLDMEFNSLDAQREACEAFVRSQRHEGWILVPDRYDDGGFSGATMERPALARLLRDMEGGLIDCIVVYKVDRLSRCLADFARMVETFEQHEVSFVSVTQQFNTTTSMGRLTLNVLLSFAQFEREVIGERIRDKFAASRRKGMWMGGMPPLGYDVKDRKLVVNKDEAGLIRHVFQRFVQLGAATVLAKELAAQGHRTKSWTTQSGQRREGRPLNKGVVYRILNNRVYLGEAVHKGKSYRGEHKAIVSQALWDRVHAILSESPRRRANQTRAQTPALLKGLIRCKHCGSAMTPSHTRRRGKLYRYYLCVDATKNGNDACPVRSVPAGEIEQAVIDQVRVLLRTPELVARTWRTARLHDGDTKEGEVTEALQRLDPVWEELFPAEQARVIQLLVNSVEIEPDGLEIQLRVQGLESLIAELSLGSKEMARSDAA